MFDAVLFKTWKHFHDNKHQWRTRVNNSEQQWTTVKMFPQLQLTILLGIILVVVPRCCMSSVGKLIIIFVLVLCFVFAKECSRVCDELMSKQCQVMTSHYLCFDDNHFYIWVLLTKITIRFCGFLIDMINTIMMMYVLALREKKTIQKEAI